MPKRISFHEAAGEPYRFFFPQAVLAGLLGVSLWPLYFLHATEFYPGLAHVRIMAHGFFGGFIFGFLGTALPPMLSVKRLRAWETLTLLALHGSMTVAYAAQKLVMGDALFLALLLGFASLVAARWPSRKDTPPPGFLLVGLAFVCAAGGATLGILENYREIPPVWLNLQRLLSGQGFTLLPILGVGPFLLPRFFGMESPHDFPEAATPPAGWWRKAGVALVAGVWVVASFFAEAFGHHRTAHAVRAIVTAGYLLLEFPLHRAPKMKTVFGVALRIAFAIISTGFVTVAVFPQFRVGLMHLTLVGGFALVTFVVATRVVFGHSGQAEKLGLPNRWFLVAEGLMLFAMATRVSGDFWPKIMQSHYIYGAALWAIGVALWAWKVLPKILDTD